MVWIVCVPCVITGVFIRGREEGLSQNVMTEAEVGVIRVQGPKMQAVLRSWKRQKNGFSPEGALPYQPLDVHLKTHFELLISKNWKTTNLCCFKPRNVAVNELTEPQGNFLKEEHFFPELPRFLLTPHFSTCVLPSFQAGVRGPIALPIMPFPCQCGFLGQG